MNKQTGLGKGLDSLMPTNFDTSLLLSADERIQKLFIKEIDANPDQPRKEFDKVALQELAQSIAKHGVLQPIIVSPTKTGSYVIVAGERRWRASKIAGIGTIPAIVREQAALQQLEIALIENVQRVDLSPLEQAISIQRLHEQFNLSYQEIANKLGKAPPTVNNIVRLLQLPKAGHEALRKGKISEGHARAILALKDSPHKQQQLLDFIQLHSWSVRQAEQFVAGHKQGLSSKQALPKRVASETPETLQLSKKFGTKVKIQHTAKGGRLEIHFKNDQELARLYDELS